MAIAANTDFNGFQLPDIGKMDTSILGGGSPQYGDVISQIQKVGQLPSITSTVMPSIQDLLSPTGQKVSPYAKAIEQKTSQNVAQTQTDMMKRGLTGSDIEMQGIQGARSAGQNAMAQMYGETANQLSQMIYQAATGDLQNNRELLMTLAQAMGQELTSQRDMQMFKEALQASIEQAEAYRRSQGMSAMIGGLFGAGGAVIGGSYGGPTGAMAGLGAGQALGSGFGGMVGR